MLESDEIDDDDEVFFSARGTEGIVKIDGDDRKCRQGGCRNADYSVQRPEAGETVCMICNQKLV